MTDRRNLNKSMGTLFPQERSNRCRVCNEPVVDGRWNYCSERCRDIANAVQRMFLWESVRDRILERDDRTCQVCGFSYGRAMRAYWQILKRIDELVTPLPRKSDHPGADMDRWRRAERELLERYNPLNYNNNAFHVDHITPISEGGHPFDESNLQTLCRECHEQKTARENSDSGAPAEELTLQDYMES
jgi:5-methylcytosine-specific restriction endonuclease McrA